MFVGPVTGAVTGNVTGNLTGNVAGNVTGSLTGPVTGNVTGNLTGSVTGNVTGNLTGSVTGNVTGNTTGIHTGAIVGVTGTSSANAGEVGEYISSSGGGQYIPSGTNQSISPVSINLTKGDWDISGWCEFVVTSATTTLANPFRADILNGFGSISAFVSPIAGTTLTYTFRFAIPETRVSISSNTQFFLQATASFSGASGSVLPNGFLRARRVR
jgi:hypothetical protein